MSDLQSRDRSQAQSAPRSIPNPVHQNATGCDSVKPKYPHKPFQPVQRQTLTTQTHPVSSASDDAPTPESHPLHAPAPNEPTDPPPKRPKPRQTTPRALKTTGRNPPAPNTPTPPSPPT